MSASPSNDQTDGYDRLYAHGITSTELSEIANAAHADRANVVAVMLSPQTPPMILRHYLVMARNALEADTRAMYTDIVGARDADSSVALGIKARFHDEQQRAYNSTLGDSRHPSASSASASASSSMHAELSDEERAALKEIERVQAYIDLFEHLAELVVGSNVEDYDLVVARLTFFSTMAASRSVKGLVMAPQHRHRLPEHVALSREKGTGFFPVLNYLTDQYYMKLIDGQRYLRELACFFHTGMPLGQVAELERTRNNE